MYTYKTKGGKEISMNEKAREGFQKFAIQNNDLFAECVKAYTDGNINKLAALTASLYSRLNFLYCVFDEKDKTFLNITDDLLYTLILYDNSETENVIKYLEAMKSEK